MAYGYEIGKPGIYYQYDENVTTCCNPPQYRCKTMDGGIDYITCDKIVKLNGDDPLNLVLGKLFRHLEDSLTREKLNNELNDKLIQSENKINELTKTNERLNDSIIGKYKEIDELKKRNDVVSRQIESLTLMLYCEKTYGERVEKPMFASFNELRDAYPDMIDTAFSICLNNYKVELITKIEKFLQNKKDLKDFPSLFSREGPYTVFMHMIRLISESEWNDDKHFNAITRLRRVLPDVLTEAMMSSHHLIGANPQWREWVINHFGRVITELFDYVLSCKEKNNTDSVLKYMDMVNASYRANVEYANLHRWNRSLWGDDITLTDDEGKLKEFRDIVKDNGFPDNLYLIDIKSAMYGDDDVAAKMMEKFMKYLDIKSK